MRPLGIVLSASVLAPHCIVFPYAVPQSSGRCISPPPLDGSFVFMFRSGSTIRNSIYQFAIAAIRFADRSFSRFPSQEVCRFSSRIALLLFPGHSLSATLPTSLKELGILRLSLPSISHPVVGLLVPGSHRPLCCRSGFLLLPC